MSNRRSVVIAVSSCLVLGACSAPDPNPPLFDPARVQDLNESSDFRKRLLASSEQLDRVAAYTDEWGTISISAPLVCTTSTDFAFNLSMTDDELFDGNKATEGFSFFGRGSVVDARGQVSVARTPAASDEPDDKDSASKQAAEEGEADDSTESEGDSEGESDEQSETSGETVGNSALQAVGDLTPFDERFRDDLQAGQRRIIRKTASDRFEIGLHKALSGSNGTNISDGYRLMYLVFTVAGRPGWRTRAGYIGQVDVSIEYGQNSGQSGSLAPMVIAVYPAFEGQELDLRASARQLYALAADLAFAGKLVSAKAMLQTALRIERDSQTRTGLSLVTSYSDGGRNFGYEFRPTFRSQVDPASDKPVSGYELDAVTFPAVAVVAVHEADWLFQSVQNAMFAQARLLQSVDPATTASPAVQMYSEQSQKALNQARSQGQTGKLAEALRLAAGDIDRNAFAPMRTLGAEERTKALKQYVSEKLQVRFKEHVIEDWAVAAAEWATIIVGSGFDSLPIKLDISHYWRPVGETRMNLIGKAIAERNVPRADERTRAIALAELADAGATIQGFTSVDPFQYDVVLVLRERWSALQARLTNINPILPVPNPFAKVPGALNALAVLPSQGAANASNTFHVIGGGFSKDDGAITEIKVLKASAAVSPPVGASLSHRQLGSRVLEITVPAAFATAAKSDQLTFQITRDDGSVTTSPVFAIKDPPGPAAPTVKMDIKRGANGIESIILPEGILNADKEKLQAIMKALEKCCPEEKPKDGKESDKNPKPGEKPATAGH